MEVAEGKEEIGLLDIVRLQDYVLFCAQSLLISNMS